MDLSSMDPVVVSDSDDSDGKDKTDSEVVIDLDEYSKSKSKRKSFRCINCECESGENLRLAPLCVLDYYQVTVKFHKNQEICEECYNVAINYYDNLCHTVENGTTIVSLELPIRTECIEIDSDEEKEQTEPLIPDADITDDAKQFIENNLWSTVNELYEKYKVDEQIDATYNYVSKMQFQHAELLDETEKLYKTLQERIDVVRKELYDEFPTNTTELPAIEIVSPDSPRLLQANLNANIHTNVLQHNLHANLTPRITTVPPTKTMIHAAERRSHRNVTKPASYCELTTDDVDHHLPDVGLPSVHKEMADQGVPADIEALMTDLPPIGPFPRPALVVGETYYAMRPSSVFAAWGKVKLLDIVRNPDTGIINYRIKFDSKSKGQVKVVDGKQLAYATPSPVRLEVGTRVIAVFTDETAPKKELYFTGVIAELSITNQFRYLVFFDDGYAQYVPHHKVLVVMECSENVWDDIHPGSRQFIKKYLELYPERPMVKVQPQQVVKTEWNGKWWVARVMKVEGSLAQMHFDADGRSEWIYRGSTRLGPLFLEMQAAQNRLERGPHIPKMQNRKNLPYVEYTRTETDSATIIISNESGTTSTQQPARSVARKSTNRPANTLPTPRHLPPPKSDGSSNMIPFLPTQQLQQPQSKVVYFTPKSVPTPKPYIPHTCSEKCLNMSKLPLDALKGYNPLSKPLLLGWYRILVRYKSSKKIIIYRAPCSRAIRSMEELHNYLRITGSEMSVDMFDFDFWVHCLAEFVLDKAYCSKRDISNGVENVPIPCVNYVDNTMPDFINYSTKREPMEGVNLNLDEEFLCGCDCEDDCADKSKCACWQMTIREARTLTKRVPDELIGYTYKRLPEFVTTGIYECNSKCKCSKKTCLNRVVQHPLQLKLQLFKTVNRGWGIRCLNDIPQGTFICIYAGSLLTDKMANEGGQNYGDEYLAELDYIEVVERQKDGYESDVTDIEDEGEEKMDIDDEDYAEEDDSNDENITLEESFKRKSKHVESVTKKTTESLITTRSKKKTAAEKDDDETVTISDDDEKVREPSSFDTGPQTGDINDVEDGAPKFKSVRKMFGEDEVCYIMDAKNTGNIGRFLNHSCNPNVFVQNVFVDTHDLRFPWVAFFAMNYIRAGTELTWNYNYDVGSVPGKVIFCHCGSQECRGRLL